MPASPTTSAPGEPRARFVSTTVEVEGREEVKVVEVPDFDPAPWTEEAVLGVVGTRATRADALEKVTGQARYTADVQKAGMLHAAFVRAPVARGRVTRLDAAPALAIPGVLAVLARDDVPAIRVDGVQLFDPRIHYAGQPLAVVCAESATLAWRAARAVLVECEAEPPVLDAAQSLAEGAPKVRERGNLSGNRRKVAERGDVDAALAAADVTVSLEARTPVALHTPMEPHGAVAEWEGDVLTLHESTQGIFRVRNEVANALKLARSHVRVIKDYMGGGFGAKNNAGAHTYAAALLARRLARPVRCVNDREGEQLDGGNRPATVQRVTLGAARDGRLVAIRLDAEIPLGIGGWEGGPGKIFHELYSCPNVRTTEAFAWTNTSPMASFRAPGHVEGAFALERAMDVLAARLGMDPLALRLRNWAARDEEKDRPWSANRLRECYAAAAFRFGWPGAEATVRAHAHEGDAVVARVRAVDGISPTGGTDGRENGTTRASTMMTLASPGAMLMSGGAPGAPRDARRFRRGVGMAAQVWGAGGGPPAYALVRMESDGSVQVLTGTQDLGTGARTIFAQVAAEVLALPVEQVRVVLGDTERLPYTGNSWGSATTPSVAPAVRMAAEDARAQLFQAAAQFLKATADALVARDGAIHVRGDGEPRSITYRQLARQLGDVMVTGRGTRGPNPKDTALASFGAQFAEVEVDVETGVVRVLRIVAAHDAGRILNPTLAESQLEGGILQGLGYALWEERVVDARTGIPLNPTTHDYKVATIADLPAIEAFCVQGSDTVANHVGARGLAEPPIIPTAPAIANAVANAIGVAVDEIPLTPWRVLRVLGKA